MYWLNCSTPLFKCSLIQTKWLFNHKVNNVDAKNNFFLLFHWNDIFKYLLAPFLFSVIMNVKYLKIVNIFIIWNGILSSHVCMGCILLLLFVSTLPHSRNKKNSLLLTYLYGLSHASRASRISSSSLLLFNSEEAFWLLLFFSPILISLRLVQWDRHTKKKGEMKKSRLAVATTSTSHTFR